MNYVVLAMVSAVGSGLAGAPQAGVIETSAPAAVSVDRAALTLPAPKAGRTRPLVVVVAENAGAETTDFVVPYGVLKDSGVADVRALSTGEGPVQLLRGVLIAVDQTVAAFDQAEPAGADVVIVPAQKSPSDPVLVDWLQSQAARGAVIVSVCEGARVVARAGLFEGRRATSHWSSLNALEHTYPQTQWVRNSRYIQDGQVISSTGVTASIPLSLALVEAIGGREVALATAGRLGVGEWGPHHRTADFSLSRMDFAHAVLRVLAFWTHEKIELPVSNGIDEVDMALQSDVWGRSARAHVVTTSSQSAPVVTEHGLVVLPGDQPRPGRFVIPAETGSTVMHLDRAIDTMGRRYGPLARRLAVSGLEYDPPGAH
ncbi:DJ-1/PfpI family protein [soil metagenome]